MKSFISIAVISTLMIASCQKSDAPGPAGGTPTVLEGTWKSNCRLSSKQTFQFTGNTLKVESETFGDSDCVTPSTSSSFLVSFVIGGPATMSGITEFDLSYVSPLQNTVTVHSATLAALLNAEAVCGFSDWATGISKTTTHSANCFLATDIQNPFYGIFKLDGNILYFGNITVATGEGSTPEKRSIDLGSIILIKQ